MIGHDCYSNAFLIDHIAIKNHYLQIYFNSGGGASESQCLTPEVTPEVAPMCNCTLGSVGLDVGSDFSLDGGSALATTSTTATTTTTTAQSCGNELTWPDLDHDLVCGDCKVLVDNMDIKY